MGVKRVASSWSHDIEGHPRKTAEQTGLPHDAGENEKLASLFLAPATRAAGRKGDCGKQR